MKDDLKPVGQTLLELLLEQARDHGLILLDAGGRVMAWFAGAEEIFGFTAEDMTGRTLHPIFTPEDIARRVPEHEREVATAIGRAEDDRWQMRKDGTRIWVTGLLYALRDDSARLVGFAKVVRDRTDAREHVDTIENRLETATQAARRKDVFIATLGHELRNPLAALVNALAIVRAAGPVDERLSYPIQIIERQTEALRRLVADLLDVSRIAAGKVELKTRPLDLDDVLRAAVESVRPRAEQKRQSLLLLLLDGPTPIEADGDRLQQVFVNLLDNAVKYTDEGGHVWVKGSIEGHDALVRVQDTGAGIDPSMLPQLFDLFTQDPSARHRAEGGLGLGLPLVREIVALHGGTVQVRSEGPGKGSEFTVRLPLARPSTPEG